MTRKLIAWNDIVWYAKLKDLCDYAGVDISHSSRVEITQAVGEPVRLLVEHYATVEEESTDDEHTALR
jgi:hypothetical protein